MSRNRTAKQVPKLENLGKITTAAFLVPVISSLLLYWLNGVYFAAFPQQQNENQTRQQDLTTNQESSTNQVRNH